MDCNASVAAGDIFTEFGVRTNIGFGSTFDDGFDMSDKSQDGDRPPIFETVFLCIQNGSLHSLPEVCALLSAFQLFIDLLIRCT